MLKSSSKNKLPNAILHTSMYKLEEILSLSNTNKRGRFIGEETYSKGSSKEYLIKDEPTWCIDPLDGTF